MHNFLLSLLLISSILFTGWSRGDTLTPGWTPPEDYREDGSMEKVFEPSENNEEFDKSSSNMSMEDIFGSEQVFPFPPGLGN